MQNKSANDTPARFCSDQTPAGIYIHVPFCQAKCAYCDFYSITAHAHIPAYLDALLTEIALCRARVPLADTIYFGGGTPSLLTPRQVATILEAVHDAFTVSTDAEVTVEVNPGTVSPSSLCGFRAAGVNRLNIGLQSTRDQTLHFLGRIHTAAQALDTYRWARQAGFDNVGLDLIYGIPGQTRNAWQAELTDVAGLGAEHLSCYTLTLEAHTPLAEKVRRGIVTAPDEAVVGDLFALTIDGLNSHGYRQYEISNFARRSADRRIDHRSRHNRKYWNFASYLGFGPAAHSYLDNRRWWNHRSLATYLADLAAGRLPVAETESLTRDQQLIEYIYLGLRQTDGIDTDDFRLRFGRDFFDAFDAPVKQLMAQAMMVHSRGRVRLTVAGMRLLESVVDLLIGQGQV